MLTFVFSRATGRLVNVSKPVDTALRCVVRGDIKSFLDQRNIDAVINGETGDSDERCELANGKSYDHTQSDERTTGNAVFAHADGQ